LVWQADIVGIAACAEQQQLIFNPFDGLAAAKSGVGLCAVLS